MSATSTPRSEPAAPPPFTEDGEHTPIVPASVNDMFDLAAPPVEAPVVARLVPVSPGVATVIPLRQDQQTTTIGRSKELPLPFRIENVAKLSGKHCDVAVDPITLRVTLRDTSANGTYVNGMRVPKGEVVVLHAGDTVSLTKPVPAPNAGEKGSAEEQVDFIFQRLKEETDVKTMVQELTCGICLNIYHRPVSVLPCMHVFCASCISTWLREDRTTCAECRGPIHEVRPTHKIQSCVEQLLLADSSRRRAPEELRRLDELDDIPPAGKVLRKRGRSADDLSGGDLSGSDDSDGSDHVAVPARLLAAGVNFGALAGSYHGAHPQGRCPQCEHPSTLPDHFQCVAGGPHLVCTGCRRPFPERPLCGRAQRCHLCSTPYCGRYFAAEALQTADGQPSHMPSGCGAEPTPQAGGEGDGRLLMPVGELQFHCLPAKTFGGNTTEIAILTAYLAIKGILAESVWGACLARLKDDTWKPNLPSVNGPLTADSLVCVRCAARVFSALLFHYRRAIPASELPEAVTTRPNCWYGVECRTQFHNPSHAQNFNHVCYQEKRKE